MFEFITGLIGGLLYPLFSIIFVMVDMLQGLFMQLAGVATTRVDDELGSITISAANNGESNGTGLIFYFMNHHLVKNLLMSITLLALFLLIIFTVMAFIKNAYAAKPKSWQEIIGNTLKGLINFVFVPVCCLLGIWVSNILLIAINSATSSGGSANMSRKLFICAAYNANSYRLGTESGEDRVKHIYEFMHGDGSWASVSTVPPGMDENIYYAQVVDDVYASTNISIYEWGTVEMGYSLYQVNYLILIVGGIFMMYVLVTLAYAMIRRILILLMLFVISPALCAMYPLDEGKAVGQWRGNFISTTLGAYGAVAGMNIFFSLLPLLEQIGFDVGFAQLSSGGGSSLVGSIIHLLMMVCGLFVVKEMMQMISTYVGGDDAFSKGSSLRASTTKAVRKYGNKAISGAFKYGSKAVSSWKDARKSEDKGGRGLGRRGALGAALGGMFASIGRDITKASGTSETIKGIRDAIKESKSEVKDASVMRDLINDIKAALGEDGFTARGHRGKWNASASLEDLLKIAESMGVKEIGAKGARVDLEQLKLDTESTKALGDAAKSLDKVANSIQTFLSDNHDIMSGMTLDDFAQADLRHADAEGHLSDRDKEINEAIKQARELVKDRDAGISDLNKASSDAEKDVQTEQLRNIVHQINMGAATLKNDEVKADYNLFAQTAAMIKGMATNGKVSSVSVGEDGSLTKSAEVLVGSVSGAMDEVNRAIATSLSTEITPIKTYLRKLTEDSKDKK